MKLMYLTFQEEAPLYLGVVRKIGWQAEAFRKLGFDVTYTLWSGRSFRFITKDGAEAKTISGGHGMMRKFSEAARLYLNSHPFDVLYLRLDRISFDVLRLCRAARANGAKTVVIELPNYPYLRDYIGSANGVRPLSRRLAVRLRILGTVAEDRLSALGLRRLVDAAVLIGNRADRFFGVKAINISNGVDVDAMSAVPPKNNPRELVLIGVAGTLWWQGYDRVLAGMHRYQKEKPAAGPNIRFILVGGDRKEMPEFLSLVRRYGLEDSVECPGFQSGKALDASYARADLGVSTLGCYRRGLRSCSSLKAREYCARGLPFLYAYEDALPPDAPFALKLPNDPSPVDMDAVVRFAENCRRHPEISERERAFAREHYDWKNIMKRVLDFAQAAAV